MGPKAQQLKLTSCNNWSWHIDRFQQLGTEPRSEGSRIGAKNLQQLELTVEPMVQQLERSIQELERGSEGSTIGAKNLQQLELTVKLMAQQLERKKAPMIEAKCSRIGAKGSTETA